MEQKSAARLVVDYRQTDTNDAEDRLEAALDLIVSRILADYEAHPEDHNPTPRADSVP